MGIKADFDRAYGLLVEIGAHENPFGSKQLEEWINSTGGLYTNQESYIIHISIGSIVINFKTQPISGRDASELQKKYDLVAVSVGGDYLFLTPQQYSQLAIDSHGIDYVVGEIRETSISIAYPLLLSREDTGNLVEDLAKELYNIE